MCAPPGAAKIMDENKLNKQKLPDVFLCCDEPTLEFAQKLKQQVEARCNLQVALENDDSWEDSEEDCVFMDHMDQAKQMIVIATEHSNLTAWVMDYDETKKARKEALEQRLGCTFERCCKPPTVDFRTSEKDGLNEFMDLLRMNTGYRRFRKPSSSPLVNSLVNAIFI